MKIEYTHYFKALPAGCTHIDVYRVLSLFEVSDPALQHAVKKLLCAGARGAKDQAQDIAEAIATLQRWQQMREEEQPAPDLREAVAEMREIRGRYCECGAREASACPGQWEPGCDLGANEAHAVPAPAEDPDEHWRREAKERQLNTSQEIQDRLDRIPVYAPAPGSGPEDAERAAYLARWEDAPEWAQWLSESAHGVCKWHKRKPELVMGAWTAGEQSMQDAHDLLGSVRCESRPTTEASNGDLA